MDGCYNQTLTMVTYGKGHTLNTKQVENFRNIFLITNFCNKIPIFALIATFRNILLRNFVIVLIREL